MTLPLFPTAPAPPRRVSLIRLAGEIARALATVGRLAVEGEVYQPRRVGGGRVYFTLRDRAAQLSVMCPQSKASRCRAVAGERVCVVGALMWINERGQLQLVAEEVMPVGDGAVAAMIADARRRLAADGLLDRPRRPLPRLPGAIGVVCGSEAAVRQDIESVVAVRFPGYPMQVVETQVSGPGAAISIIDALAALAAHPAVDVIILARGGGDATQLLPFSDEELCRAICRCPVPVVSAIGHDGDRPLCDDVADHRFGTPSLAAAATVPDRAALLAELAALQAVGALALQQRVESAQRRLAAIDTRQAARAGAAGAAARLEGIAGRLQLLHPRRQLLEAGRRLDAIDRRGPAARAVAVGAAGLAAIEWRRRVDDSMARAAARLSADGRHLHALSPTRVLERGYAVVRDPYGRVIRRAGQVAAGQQVAVQLSAGRLATRVEEVIDA